MKVKSGKALVREIFAHVRESAYPDGVHDGLAALIGVSTVTLSDEVATAQIARNGGRYDIRFGRGFVARWLTSPRDALFVLLHEVQHKVNGDLLRDFGTSPRERQAANLVTDIRINSKLCRLFSDEPTLIDRFYRGDAFPELLLLPPRHFRCAGPDLPFDADVELDELFSDEIGEVVATALVKLGHPAFVAEAAAEWYTDAWFGRATVQSLYERLLALFSELGAFQELGDHEGPPLELPGDWETGLGAGAGGRLGEETTEVTRPARVNPRLLNEVRRTLTPDPRARRFAAAYGEPELRVVPYPGRRETFLRQLGMPVLAYKQPVFQRVPHEDQAHVYIDVSGSMDTVLPLVYGLSLHLAELLGESHFMFSTEVRPATLKDLAAGRVATTGGTDFDAVVDHAHRRGFRKILVLTDGRGSLSHASSSLVHAGTPELYAIATEDGFSLRWPFFRQAKQVWGLREYGM